MRKALLFLSLLLLTWSLPLRAQSSDETSPLLMSAVRDNNYIIEQDLYQYQDGQWQSLTSGGFKGGFSLSPDGVHMAYLAVPDLMRQAVAAGQNYLLGAVWDIELLDLTTGETSEVAVQPADVSLSTDGTIRHGTNRSLPDWSPDGNALAWTEQDYPAQNTARLVVADLSTGETRVLDDALPQMTQSEDGLPMFLAWGQPGIIVFTNDPTTTQAEVRFYDPAAGLIWTGILPDEPPDWAPMSGLRWVKDKNGQILVVQPEAMIWDQFDRYGLVSSFSKHLEQVSANGPSKSLRFVWDIFAVSGQDAWTLVSPHGTTLVSWPTKPTSYAISPSGQQAAYAQDGSVFLWQDDTATEIAPPDGLKPLDVFWGPMQWQAGEAYDSIG